MNQEEYLKWEKDAAICLFFKYSVEEIEKILDWFRNIKSSKERDMIGNDRVEAFLIFHSYDSKWNMYDSLMIRLWKYAPYILEQE